MVVTFASKYIFVLALLTYCTTAVLSSPVAAVSHTSSNRLEKRERTDRITPMTAFTLSEQVIIQKKHCINLNI